jgi:archaellum component FlaC
MTSLKDEYKALKTKHDKLKDTISSLQGKKEVAEKELKKIDVDLSNLTKGKDPYELLEKLEKEIEVRLELIRGDVLKLEREVESFLVDEEPLFDDSGSSDFNIDLEDLDEDKD